MAQVYLALDPNIDREVALKVFLPRHEVGAEQLKEMRRRFIQEAKAAGRVRHPGIVMIYDADTDAERDLSYIAMERIEGRSLWEMLAEDGPMPEVPAVEIVAKVALALHAAHEDGLVHLDVKPGNILCSLDGSIKVTDFGIAQLSSVPSTQSDWISGSPFYMSPEQLAGADVDLRSDVYSLGAVLYECLSGTVPFTSESLAGLKYMIEEIDPRPLQTFDSRIRGELACVAMKALSKSPSDRFQSTLDMAKALASAMKIAPLSVYSESRPGLVSAGDPPPALLEPPYIPPLRSELSTESVPEAAPSAVAHTPVTGGSWSSLGDGGSSKRSSTSATDEAAVEKGVLDTDAARVSELVVPPETDNDANPVPQTATSSLDDASPPLLAPEPARRAPAAVKQRSRRRGRLIAASLVLVLGTIAGVFALRPELRDVLASTASTQPAEPLSEVPAGAKVVVARTPSYAPVRSPYALDAYNLGDPPTAPAEMEATRAAQRAALRRRQATARQLVEDAVQARAADSAGGLSKVGSILTEDDIQPVEEIAAPVAMATLELVFRNRLKGGTVTVTVDGETVWAETFSGAKNVLRRTVGKDVWVTVPVAAGDREIAVRVTGSNGKVDLSKSTTAAFGEDETRRLRLVHIPPRALKFSWKDGEGD